jgi:hypothetical protein
LRAFVVFEGVKKQMALKGGKRMKMDLTGKRMEKVIILNAPASVTELLKLAASHQEISRSEFVRRAIKERASRVLSGIDGYLSNEAGSVIAHGGTAKKPQSNE